MQHNVTHEVKGDVLTIKVDLSKPGEPSKSGKSLLVGSSGGFMPVTGRAGFSLSINVIKSK